jgi:hypothetical protein
MVFGINLWITFFPPPQGGGGYGGRWDCLPVSRRHCEKSPPRHTRVAPLWMIKKFFLSFRKWVEARRSAEGGPRSPATGHPADSVARRGHCPLLLKTARRADYNWRASRSETGRQVILPAFLFFFPAPPNLPPS